VFACVFLIILKPIRSLLPLFGDDFVSINWYLRGGITHIDNIPLPKPRSVAQGTVKWFNQTKGFGFIEREGGNDLFVHISEVEGEITDGDTVEFEVGEGPKGPNAVGVRKVE